MKAFVTTGHCVVGAGLILTLLASSSCFPDDVTLQNGGVLRGRITKSGRTVVVTTSDGTRVVLEQSSVRKIQHGSSAASTRSGKVRLTDEEKAWIGQVRKLLHRVESADKDASARAFRDLRSIDDPNAIPALAQYLRTSDLEPLRLLYVGILGAMPGPKPAVGLVEEALFDSSPLVRTAAQEASRKQRPEAVRPYYGQALRFPNRDVVCRAASVLAAVGNKENVPSLIDSLYSNTVEVVYRPTCCMSRIAFLALPQRWSNGMRYLAPDNLVRQADGTYRTDMTNQEQAVAVPVVRTVENPQVKEALEAITKQSFGYDTAAWRQWWKSAQLADDGGR